LTRQVGEEISVPRHSIALANPGGSRPKAAWSLDGDDVLIHRQFAGVVAVIERFLGIFRPIEAPFCCGRLDPLGRLGGFQGRLFGPATPCQEQHGPPPRGFHPRRAHGTPSPIRAWRFPHECGFTIPMATWTLGITNSSRLES